MNPEAMESRPTMFGFREGAIGLTRGPRIVPSRQGPSRRRRGARWPVLAVAVLLGALEVSGRDAEPAQPRLVEVNISPEGRVKASAVAARPELVQGGWTEFEIVIQNTAGLTTPLGIECAQLLRSDDDAARDRWLKLEVVPSGALTGAAEEKRVLRLWSRDAGRRAAVFNVNAGQGSQDLGFRSDVLLTFVVAPRA